MGKYQKLQWVIQRNLTNDNYLQGLKDACQNLGTGFIELDIIPFTATLPAFVKSKRSVIYGSTTFIDLAYRDKELKEGVFFEEKNFSIENYIEKWGRYMLNFGAIITSFKELVKETYASDKLLFIRPDDDSKSFAGEVKQFDEINEWYNQLKAAENTNLSPDSKIVVSEPYNIQFEWRLWIVNKKVVAASKYREYFKLKKEEGCPAEVVTFAEERCKEYTPHDVFVMDVCLCGDQYYIVECNCMNGAGFYNANIADIVNSVSGYFI
jgi:hypothetical protein